MEMSKGYLRKMKVLPEGKVLVQNLVKKERYVYGEYFGPKISLYRLNADLTYDETFTPINLDEFGSTYNSTFDFDVYADGKI